MFQVLKNVLKEYNKSPDSANLLFWFYECALLTHLGFRPNLEKQDLPGVVLPDLNKRPKSGAILEKLLEEKIEQLPKESISKDFTVIAESGIKSSSDIAMYNEIGIFNFLIGESILRSDDYSEFIKTLVNNG